MRYFIPLEDLELEESDLCGKRVAQGPAAETSKLQSRDRTSPPNRREAKPDTIGSMPDRPPRPRTA